MRLLAVDPGRTTGWVVFVDGQPVLWGADLLWSDVWTKHIQLVDVVVCERFALYRHMAETMVNNEFEPAQVIGVLKFLAEKPRAVPVVFQPAAVIHKGAGKLNPLMKKLTAPYGIRNQHALDACAHGLYYLLYGKGKKEAIHAHNDTGGTRIERNGPEATA